MSALVYHQDHDGIVCVLVGAGNNAALPLRPAYASWMEDLFTILTDLCCADGRFPAGDRSFASRDFELRRNTNVRFGKCSSLVFAS